MRIVKNRVRDVRRCFSGRNLDYLETEEYQDEAEMGELSQILIFNFVSVFSSGISNRLKEPFSIQKNCATDLLIQNLSILLVLCRLNFALKSELRPIFYTFRHNIASIPSNLC